MLLEHCKVVTKPWPMDGSMIVDARISTWLMLVVVVVVVAALHPSRCSVMQLLRLSARINIHDLDQVVFDIIDRHRVERVADVIVNAGIGVFVQVAHTYPRCEELGFEEAKQ
jgi:hypothetical protein